MDRGVSSDKQHLSAIQYKNIAEQVKLRQIEDEREKKAKQMQEELERFKVAKARKEAAIETAKTLSEGIKGIFGQSSKDKQIKALKTQLNAQSKKLFNLQSEHIGQLGSATQKIEKAYQEGFSKAYGEVYNLQAQLKKAKELTADAQRYKADIEKFQSIPIIARCINAIRSFVFHINGHFDADDRRLLSFVMQGDEDAAEKIKNAAYYGCGIIGQSQYASKWDQAERELRNIANGIKEEEQQQRRGLRR